MKVRSLLILGLLLNLSGGNTRHEEGKTQPMYLDARERASLGKNFIWDVVTEYIIPQNLVQLLLVPKDNQNVTDQLSFGGTVEVLNDDTFLVKELRGSLSVSRTQRITAVHSSQELAGIVESSPGVFYIGKSDEIGTWSFYYLGATGEVAISVSEQRIALMSLGRNGIGLPVPTQGPYVGEMCFLAGVSLFRLFDAELSDWRIVTISENEWVFELDLSEKVKQRLSEFEETVGDINRVKFVLNRKRGDAPKKLEIHTDGDTIIFQALEYRSIDGVWFPSVVVMKHSSFGSVLYRLSKVSAASNLTVDIPEGTRVRDYRQLRRSVFRALVSDTFDDTAHEAMWSPKLLAEILRELEPK